MTAGHSRPREFPPRWAFFACVLAMALGVGLLVFNQWSATQDRNTAQSNAATLAQDIKRICTDQGKLMLDDRDVCAKASQVQQNPTESIPGPKGDAGMPGKDGLNGSNGATGAKGDKGDPGPPSTNGNNGTNGASGKDGQPGPTGATGPAGSDSTVPGPQGPAGAAGPAGPEGPSPKSFTFTDATGTAYTCTPNPPGSTTYACTKDTPAPAL